METNEISEERARRGIYLLPNLFTTGALFAGFYGVIAATKGAFDHAAIAILIAMIMDSLDGRVARLTNTQSAFGAEYDSLSDMTSFGVAPALVAYFWSLQYLGKIGWLGAFMYTACTALRLARFNIHIPNADTKYFKGLPSPAAAAMIASSVWVMHDYGFLGQELKVPMLILSVLAACLMVSNFSYFSFKQFDVRGKIPFVSAILIVLFFVCVSIDPPQMLFISMLFYIISGPVVSVIRRKRKDNPPEEE